jgi:hypothetical protein
MRVHFLPAEQQVRNDKLSEKLRRIGYVLFVLFVTTVALGAWLYMRPSEAGPRFASADGSTIYSDAIVLTPELVLSPAKITGPAEFVTVGERRSAQPIRHTTLPDGVEITLLRLGSPTSSPPVAVTMIEVGGLLVATAMGQEWHGSVQAKVAGGYSVTPEFNLISGTAVYREADRTAFVGFGIRIKSGTVVVAARDVLSRFAELNPGR